MSEGLGKVPSILFWREFASGRVDDPKDAVYACHAVRNWDVPSNGVFALFPFEDLFSREYSKRVDWYGVLAARLAERERRLFREYGRMWKHHLTEYFDDEIWCPI